MLKAPLYFLLSLLFLSSCDKFEWHNPYDPECPKELFTPSSPGATMEGNSVKLTWSQSNDDISGFALFRRADGEPIANLTQTQKSTTQYLDASIIPGKKYTYYVLAVAGTNKSDTIKAEITPVFPITISTGAVTELAATTAKVSGNITSAGGGTVTSRGICWSITQNPTINNSKTTEGTGPGEYTSTLTGLLAGTTYYARAYGENNRGIVYGSQVTFTTLGPPTLTTTAVSNITATSATSGGTIISDGGSPITAKGVVWSTSPNPTIDLATKTNDGTGVGAFTSTLSNLTNNTRYYIRSYATNIVGTSYGEEQSFTTSTPVPPILESLKQGLIGYYPFTGNAGDSSGNGNHGIATGISLSSDRFGFANRAYFFNGINSFPAPPDPVQQVLIQNKIITLASNYSISAWFSSSDVSKLQQCIFNSTPHTGFVVELNNDNVRSRIMSGVGPANAFWTRIYIPGTTTNFQNNQWYNLIFVKSGTTYFVYLNGQIESSVVISQATSYTESVGLVVGSIGGGSEVFKGKIDDVRIYNRALTQEEITYLANN